MEADGEDDTEEDLMEYGPGGDAAAGGGSIKTVTEKMYLIYKTKD